MLPLLLALALPVASADDKPYAMAEVGATLRLPDGWETVLWADWEFKAQSKKDGLLFKLWTTPFQVELTEAHGKAWAQAFAPALESDGASSVSLDQVQVTTVAGRPTLRSSFKLKINGDAGVAIIYSFQGRGQVLHARVIALNRNAARAEASLKEVMERMTLDKPPAELPGAEVSSMAGFGATLPEGWRAPLPEELPALAGMAQKLGRESLPPEECWAAIRPAPVGDPDLIFSCATHLPLGRLDEHSFEGVEAEMRARFFGKSDKPTPPGEQVQAGPNLGIYFRPSAQVFPLRLVLTPYAKGAQTIWAMGPHLDDTGMDAALQAVVKSIRYANPADAEVQLTTAEQLHYYLSHRTALVLVPVILLLMSVAGGLVALARRSAHQSDED